MAELTYLNEASVVHNLQARYQADLIYVSDSGASSERNGEEIVLMAVIDLFRSLLSRSQSILSTSHIHARVHQHV